MLGPTVLPSAILITLKGVILSPLYRLEYWVIWRREATISRHCYFLWTVFKSKWVILEIGPLSLSYIDSCSGHFASTLLEHVKQLSDADEWRLATSAPWWCLRRGHFFLNRKNLTAWWSFAFPAWRQWMSTAGSSTSQKLLKIYIPLPSRHHSTGNYINHNPTT